MSNPNQILLDDQIVRQINLERYSNAKAKKVAKLLDKVRDDVIAKIAALKAKGASELTLAQQKRLLREVERLQRDIYVQVFKEIEDGFEEVAKEQAGWITKSLDKATASGTVVKQLTAKRALAAAEAKFMRGKHVKDWLKDMAPAHRERLKQALQISFTENESLAAAVARVRDVTKMSARGARTFVRTANTHVAASVAEETYKENADLVSHYEWRAVLDNRTTKVCMSRDGKRYEVGKGPMPPAHPGCRSTTYAIIEGFPPPERETYGQWLARQPAKVQDDILGPKRAKLFRAGKFKVDGFVDAKGKTLTLAKLNKKAGAKPKPKPKVRSTLPADFDVFKFPGKTLEVILQEAEKGSEDHKALKRIQKIAKKTAKDIHKRRPELELEEVEEYLDGLAAEIWALARNYKSGEPKKNEVLQTGARVEMMLERFKLFATKHIQDGHNSDVDWRHRVMLNFWTKNGNDWLMKPIRQKSGELEVANRIQSRLLAAVDAWNEAGKKGEPVYRGTAARFVERTIFGNRKAGDVFELEELTATSLAREMAESFAGNSKMSDGRRPLVVQIKGLAKVRKIDPVSSFPGEEEVLLTPGLKLRVISIEPRGNQDFMTLEVVK